MLGATAAAAPSSALRRAPTRSGRSAARPAHALRTRRCTAATIARASDSISAGSSGAIASTSWASSSVRDALNTPARGDPVVGEEVDVVACPRRRARPAAVRRPSTSPAAASRPGRLAVGSTPTRPADVRPVSSTITTRRSRSGPPGAHHHVGAPGGGPPVDGADVVADDVLAQRIELGALAADQRRDACRRARAAWPAATADACATGTAAGSGPARAPGASSACPPGPAARSSGR